MKSVTEFANFVLSKGLATKAALLADGKTPEEIQQGLGESFKFEGDKLKHFVNSLDLADKNKENLKRIVVMSGAEGENAPAKSTKIEEHFYVPEFHVDMTKKAPAKNDGKGGRGGKGGGRGGPGGDKKGPKESPWGMSPEEKAAKAAKSLASQKAAAEKAAGKK